MKLYLLYILSFSFIVMPFQALTQGYQLVWEEHFNGTALNTSIWNYETQVGIWNTGANREIQHYRAGNVSVGPDGEGGNALIIEARREPFGGYQFTSGRINTQGNFAFRYGRVEARIKLPNTGNGLWPAFWTLGVQRTWPACGEIDLLEAGHLNGINRGHQTRLLNGTVHWEHNDFHAQHGREFTLPVGQSLTNYNRYILVWTPTRIEMFLNDATVPYFAMDITGADLEEFRDWAHFFIINIAVGGSFTGIFTPDGITAPLPARMYVDYIRVYQRAGEGEFFLTPGGGPPPPPALNLRPTSDFFGIFTERPNIPNRFSFGDGNGFLYLWNNLAPITGQSAFEGSQLMAFRSPGTGWCGYGIFSTSPMDLRHYANGFLHFAVRIPSGSAETFTVRMEGANGSRGDIRFAPGADPSGVLRDGNWHRVSVPMHTLRAQGLDLSACGNIFAVVSDNPTTHGFFFDDVYLSSAPLSNAAPEISTNILTVHPNPATDKFRIQMNQSIQSLEIVNMTGIVVFRTDNLKGNSSVEINSSGWAAGIYAVRAITSNGNIHSSKLGIK